jgi:RHS repeat-associated protein
VMDAQQRIALLETRTQGNDGSPQKLIRYQFGNHLGSASLELDDQGNVVSYEEYYPYGTTAYQGGRSVAEVSLKRYRYTGKERDEESGLYYHGARYYAPWLGRWTACDPAGLVDGTNLYPYSSLNPLRYKDPTGMNALAEEEVKANLNCMEPQAFVMWAIEQNMSQKMFNKYVTPVIDANVREANRLKRQYENTVIFTPEGREMKRGDYERVEAAQEIQEDWNALTGSFIGATVYFATGNAELAEAVGGVFMAMGDAAEAGNRSGNISKSITGSKSATNRETQWGNSLEPPSTLATIKGTAFPGKGAELRSISEGSVKRLERAVRAVAEDLGIPKDKFMMQRMGERKAFNPNSFNAGGNIRGIGIEVDAGVLRGSPFLLDPGLVSAWNRLNLRDRIAVTLAHETIELDLQNFTLGEIDVNSAHKLAIEFGSEFPRLTQSQRNFLDHRRKLGK